MSAQFAKDDGFSVTTRKTFIEIGGSPVNMQHPRELKRGRSMTDTAVPYESMVDVIDSDETDEDEDDEAIGRWADHEHEPSTNTPSENQFLDLEEDEYIGQGVVNGHCYGESPDHSPIHANARTPPPFMSPHGAVTPPVFGTLTPPVSGFNTPPLQGASTPPPGVWAQRFSHMPQGTRSVLPQPSRMLPAGAMVATTQPVQLSLSGCHSPGRHSSPSPHHCSPGQATPVQLASALNEPSPNRRNGSSWSPSAPPGQFAPPMLSSVVNRSATNRLSMEESLRAAASRSGQASPYGSPCASNHGSRAPSPSSRMTPRTPSNVSVSFCPAEDEANETRTTVVIRNLPRTYSREMVCEFMDSEGFASRYDFMYLPTDFRTWLAFGYAFVNMVTPEDATDIMRCLEGFDSWRHENEGKACNVVWSDPYQGLDANIERYRNSPVMNESVKDEYKPMLFANGKSIAFPLPTRKLRQPRIRRSSTNNTESRTFEDAGADLSEF